MRALISEDDGRLVYEKRQLTNRGAGEQQPRWDQFNRWHGTGFGTSSARSPSSVEHHSLRPPEPR